MSAPYKLRVVVILKDGRKLSGSYPYLAALARVEEAMSWPQCERAYTEEIAAGNGS